MPNSGSNDRDSETEARRSKRYRVEINFGPDCITAFLIESFFSSGVDVIIEEFVSNFLIEEDPKTYKEAIKSIDATFSKEAIKSEIDSLESIKHGNRLTYLKVVDPLVVSEFSKRS